MSLLSLNHPLNLLDRATEVRWCGHVLSRDNDQVLKIALDFQMVEKREPRRPNVRWKKQVKKHINKN